MLFNSHVFIFLFLPITLLIYWWFVKLGYYRSSISWLIGTSLFFYGFENPIYLGLILTSILWNFAVGRLLGNFQMPVRLDRLITQKGLLIIGIAFNLFLIAYFKYTNFFIENINDLTDSHYHLKNIILPLAISFFTFQQIAYLVDVYKGESSEGNILNYCLFVTFFPQLIAGPIVHHKEMLPQFIKHKRSKFDFENLMVGSTIFFMGAFKKVILADNVAIYANLVFESAEQGATLTFFEAWGGALAYTFQLYFNFSGYSDMAIGLALLFGIRLPLNFFSPYKALNIIEFWQRWHMTLSRFLRDYLYIALGGNRRGKTRRYMNLMVTMILGGLWHGAGWPFVIWGALHGLYIIINHAWRGLRQTLGADLSTSTWPGRLLSQSITFIAVVVAWVFFRAESYEGAMNILKGLVGTNGFVLPLKYYTDLKWVGELLVSFGIEFGNTPYLKGGKEIFSLLLLFLIVWYAPNTQQLMRHYKPTLENYQGEIHSPIIRWEPTVRWAFVSALLTVIAILGLMQTSDFLYFKF